MVPCDHEEADNQATDPSTEENVVTYIIMHCSTLSVVILTSIYIVVTKKNILYFS